MRILLALIVGILVGAAAVWYYSSTHQSQPKAAVLPSTNQAQSTLKSVEDSIQEKLHALNLQPQSIKDELARSGQVVRRKARETGQALADSAADARITAAIKAKLLANTDLSSLGISVNTTGGIVTLSGAVPSADYISKAILLAMETDGVREVVSTVQVRAKAKQS